MHCGIERNPSPLSYRKELLRRLLEQPTLIKLQGPDSRKYQASEKHRYQRRFAQLDFLAQWQVF